MTPKKRRTLLVILSFIFLLVAAGVISYSLGYALDGSFKFSKRGGLYIAASLPGSEIFIDNEKKKNTGMLNSGLFMSGLRPREYSVLVAKDGFWPWAKTIKVEEGYVAETRAFMVPQNPKGAFILKGKFSNLWTSAKQKIIALEEPSGKEHRLVFYSPETGNFLNEDPSTKQNFLFFTGEISNLSWGNDYLIFKSNKGVIKADLDLANFTVNAYLYKGAAEKVSDFERFTVKNDERLWWDPTKNEIFIDWLGDKSSIPYYMCKDKPCELTLSVFKSRLPIKGADFFPSRKDVIIIAVGNGIYAIEADSRGGQILQPIYKGKNPIFGVLRGDGAVYVLDEGSLIRIYLKS